MTYFKAEIQVDIDGKTWTEKVEIALTAKDMHDNKENVARLLDQLSYKLFRRIIIHEEISKAERPS